eukprot:m.323660 g.323660  ORF g.323660 m.323660 type:complete len:224 (+) comp29832_c0_seq1:35-706(+)
MPSSLHFVVSVLVLVAACAAMPRVEKSNGVCLSYCRNDTDCLSTDCPFCVGIVRSGTSYRVCKNAYDVCGTTCDQTADCGGACLACVYDSHTAQSYCRSTGRNGTCGHECYGDEDCGKDTDCSVCDGSNRCIGAVNGHLAQCYGNSDCAAPFSVCNGANKCVGPADCLYECYGNSDCYPGNCHLCSGDNKCHSKNNICNAECYGNSDCMDPCPVCGGDNKCVQ